MKNLQERLAALSPEQRDQLIAKLGMGGRPRTGDAASAAARLDPQQPDNSLSPAQQRMWLFEKIEGDGSAYNIASVLRVRGVLDVDALEWSINDIVRRHEILRTRFVEVDGQPTQEIAPELRIVIERTQIDPALAAGDPTLLDEAIARQVAVNFSLQHGPLLRVAVIHLGTDESVLVAVIHHIVADGWSLRLLEREISQTYASHVAGRREPAPAGAVQYRHYVRWQRQWLRDGAARQLAYWTSRLEGAPGCWPMPCEQPRDSTTDLRASSLMMPLPVALCARIRDLADAEKASAFIVLAAAFKLVLGYFAGTRDISIGTPVANRREQQFDPVIGLFSNTVVLRSSRTDGSFRDYLQQVKATALGAFSHQDLPFEQVVDAVRPERSASHPPLFQVLFALQATEDSDLALPGLDVQPIHMQRPASEFDLIFEFFLGDAANHAVLTYRTALFARSTIERMQACFLEVIERIVRDPQAPIAGLLGSLSAISMAPDRAVPAQSGAGLLAARCPLSADDRVLLGGGLPDAMKAAAREWCDASGASHALAEIASGAGASQSLLAARLLEARPTVLVLRPSELRDIEELASAGSPALHGCRLILVHGDTPSAVLIPGVAVWQCWGSNDAQGPYLLQRADGSGAVAAHRGVLGCVNALGEPLPQDVVGELTHAATADAAPAATGLRGRLTADGVRVDGFVQGHAWIDGQQVPLEQIEAALLRIPAVSSAVVVARADVRGVWRSVAHVVSSQKMLADALDAMLREQFDPALLPSGYVLLNRIPHARDGRVDVAALAQFAVLDEATRSAFAASIGREPGEVGVEWIEPPRSPGVPITRPPAITTPSQADTTAVEAYGPNAELTPALAAGPELSKPLTAFSLPDMLDRAAREHGAHGITYLGHASGEGPTQTYAALREEATSVMAGLRARGLRPGERVLLQLADSRQMLTGFWACVLCGLNPIPVAVPASHEANDKDLSKIVNAWSTLSVSLVLTSAANRDGIDALARSVGEEALPFACIEELYATAPDTTWHEPAPDDTALLLLTSGSTGAPKAVIQSHRALVSRSAATAQRFGFDSNVVSFNWMPLDHVGGLVMYHLLDVYLGARQIQCPTTVILAQPLRWLEWMSRHKVTSTWAPNFAYALVNDRLADEAPRDLDLSRLDFILNGGESIVPRTALAFLRALAPCGLRGDAMKPAWGMSETCSGVTFNGNFSPDTSSDEDSFVEVGAPIPGVTVRIVDAADRVVEEGRDGRLQIRGAPVTSGYLNNQEATSEAFTGDGWYVTGDLAVLRNGQLTITGREKDLIIVNGLNYYGHEIEQIVESVPDVLEAHVAACGVRQAGDNTDRLAIFFSAHERAQADLDRVRSEIRRTVLARASIAATYVVVMAPDELPRTSIGKIQRPQLAQRFNRGEFDARLEARQDDGVEVPAWFLQPVWQAAPRAVRPLGARRVLLFTGDSPLARQLAPAMASSGYERVVTVGFGPAFEHVSADAYVVEAGNADHHARLLDALQAQSAGPWHVVHCGACQPGRTLAALRAQWDNAHGNGLLGLVALARAIALAPAGLVESLDVASHGAFAVDGSDTPVIENGTLQGFLRSLAQELPDLRCRHIDMDDLSAGAASALLAEIGSRPTHDAVALRKGRRWVQALRPCAPEAADVVADFAGQGLCLITGGLGGIGTMLAEWLLRYTGRHVLLIGRTDLAGDGQHDQDGATRAKRQAHERLSRHAARFAYAALDVCDGDGLQALLAEREQACNLPLRQVFHLAGNLRTEAIDSEDGAALLASLRAKDLGAVVLHDLLQPRPEVEIIHFGSVNGYFGGAGVSAYAASNSFLDTLAAHRRSQGGACRCLGWSAWDGIGMSRDYDAQSALSARGRKSLTQARGFASLDAAQGMDSLCVALASGKSSVLIGVDASSPNIARFVDAPVASFWQLRVSGRAPAEALVGTDAFGTRFTGRDESAADGGAQSAPGSEMTPIERQLAGVWQDVLRVPVVGAEANFFELGGDSIMAIQVVARASKAGVVIEPRALFECQTLRELALSAHADDQDQEGPLPVVGAVALSPIQRWFFAQDFTQMQHMNQSVLLRVRQRMATELLQAALEAVLLHHDMLRARFDLSGAQVTQTLPDTPELPLEVVRLEYGDSTQYLDGLRSHADRLQASLDLSHGPVVRAGYFLGNEPADDRLLIVVHHLVIDGVSWRIVLDDLEHCVEQLLQGKPVHLGRKSSPYGQWVETVTAQAQAADAGAFTYWQDVCAQPTVLPRPDVDADNLRGTEASIEFRLDAALTRELVQRLPSARGVGVNDILLAALYQAYRTWSGSPRMLLTLEGHGRGGAPRGLDLSRTVGWFTAMYPVALAFQDDTALSALVTQVRDHLASVPEEGRLYLAMRHPPHEQARSPLEAGHAPQIGFNYLGRFDVDDTRLFAFASEAPGQQISPLQQRFHELDVVGTVIDEEMRFSFIYSGSRYAPSSVQGFVDAFADALRHLAGESAAVAARPAWAASAPGLEKLLSMRGIASERVHVVMPATPMQGGLIYESQVSDLEGTYVSHLMNELAGTLDADALRRAWQEVVSRHEIYRTGFFPGADGRFLQVVLSAAEMPWIEMDWSTLSTQVQEMRFSQLLADDSRRGFDVQQPPLLRVHLIRMAGDRHRMLISEHHCVSDGWSRGVLLSEVAALYRRYASGARVELAEAVPFGRYVDWLQGFDTGRAQAYWDEYLRDMEPMPDYAWQTIRPRATYGGTAIGRRSIRIPRQLTAALAETARSNRLTLGTLVQAAWGLVMAVQTGRDDVNFLTVHSGRPPTLEGVERIIGPLICTVPVRIDMARQASMLDAARSLQRMQADRNEHGYLSLADCCASLGKRRLRSMFGTLFAFENFPLTAPEAGEGELQVAWVKSLDVSDTPLSVMVVPGEEIEAVFYHRADLFDDEAVARIAACFEAALAHAASQPSAGLAGGMWMDAAEWAALPDRIAARGETRRADSPERHDVVSSVHEF